MLFIIEETIILKNGFGDELKEIFWIKRQTLFFSAALSEKDWKVKYSFFQHKSSLCKNTN